MIKVVHLLRFLVLLFLLTAFGCGKPLPEFSDMNLETWKTDKKGCDGARQSMIEPLKNQWQKLQGLSEMQIIDLLGRPDEYDLGKRHQKFFGYWLAPGLPCGLGNHIPMKLSIRFNATGAAKEISVE